MPHTSQPCLRGQPSVPQMKSQNSKGEAMQKDTDASKCSPTNLRRKFIFQPMASTST
eukprot:UN15026